MICYFSGTGNSRWVAKTVSAHFADNRLVDMADAVVSGNSLSFNLSEGEQLGFVFPVHSWGIPWIVRRFIKKMTVNNYYSNLIYCILTCGDDSGLTNRMLQKLFRRKGWLCRHIYSVQMPNTYVVFPGFDADPIDLEQKKKADAVPTLDKIMAAIESDSPIDCYLQKGQQFLKSRIIYPLFCKFKMSSKPFYYTDKCIGCGICIKNCPTHNIRLENGHPVWSDYCTQCLSCLHRCPQTAIEYGKQSIGKRRYYYGKSKKGR
ncbi:MAG: EFR1 family ferrodoxin [Salinivirgaceae bacterium]|nr:EFR1 family ferrodoxin [Salinivirgaceae bacterium]